MKVVVIGAGTGGLCAAKNSLQAGLEVTVFEQTGEIGGTWVFRDEVGKDEFGLDIHSSMYRGLKTNLPKEIMGFPDFHMTGGEQSFVTAKEVLDWHHEYADHFDLRKWIKFYHNVVRVKPHGESQWEVLVKDLKQNSYSTTIFDAVFICNGHYSAPSTPNFPGRKLFRGRQMHSHDYRSADVFRGERVLVIGAGPSGMDITNDAGTVAEIVVQCHHWQEPPNVPFPSNVTQKIADVVRLTEDGAVFSDGSTESFTLIVYCTGYKFTFPFLSVDCGIHVQQNYISPLYQHCLNINRPTMAFIGICNYVIPQRMMDLQIRFFLKFLTGGKELPSRAEMLASEKYEITRRLEQGISLRKAHFMGPDQGKYFETLAKIADITPIPPVFATVHTAVCALIRSDIRNFRRHNYRIIDDHSFERLT
ncbi:senecionine N-oxygenase-like [Phlebotomus argentipes]|uniref:senecionine N-oxygenase-like n=1 Tax=Phlebotomus argentipes TaxID=94469 RepID=UPI002892EA0E|nr:senecionine N-oxygenase-like [Phlebotomus argentipes]